MFFGMIACLLYIVASTDTTNILSIYSIISSKASSLVILNDPNCSNNASILFSQH